MPPFSDALTPKDKLKNIFSKRRVEAISKINDLQSKGEEEELAISAGVYARSIYDINNNDETFSVFFSFSVRRELSLSEMEEYEKSPEEFVPKFIQVTPMNCVQVIQQDTKVGFDGKDFLIRCAEDGTLLVAQRFMCRS